jgi:hypothetical protein
MLLRQQTGLSTASFSDADGSDSDSPRALGGSRQVRVAIDTLEDFLASSTAFRSTSVTTLSMTIKSPATVLWAMYWRGRRKAWRLKIASTNPERHLKVHRQRLYVPPSRRQADQRYGGVRRKIRSALESITSALPNPEAGCPGRAGTRLTSATALNMSKTSSGASAGRR